MSNQTSANMEKTVVETTKIKGSQKTPEQITLGEQFHSFETWEELERNVNLFHGNSCTLEFPFVFQSQENPAKRVDFDHLISQSAITGQSLSSYIKSGCSSPGIHAVKL